MRLKHKLIIIVPLILIPPVAALGLAAALDWVSFEWSLRGVVYVLGAYAAWIAILGGLAEFTGFFREKEPPAPTQLISGSVGESTDHVAIGRDITQTHMEAGTYVAGDYIEGARQSPPGPPLQRPPRATHFTGRQAELDKLIDDLQPGQVVTLCGPGGIGKTALAAEAVWTLSPENTPPERFPDGVIFHTFYNQPQAALALEAIARAYGEEPRPGPAAAAGRALSGRVALLILDGAENADDLDAVLAVRGQCAALITTRRHADAPADWEDIEPLPNPQAVELLQAWGGDCAADEDAAGRICTLVGALPLAVRLAGRYMAQRGEEAADYLAWLKKTPLAALHFGDRQRDSADVLLTRSVGQVSDAARAALGVAGILALVPFDREAVAAALEVEAPAAGRALGELVDYGLLLRGEDKRYQTSHALVHTYARERLAPADEVFGRLAAYYTALAGEQSALGLEGHARLDDERPHLMAVLETCVKREAWGAACSLVWAINDYLDIQGHWTERITALEMGLVAARALGDRGHEGAFLGNLGNAYLSLGQVERAIEQYEQAQVIYREFGDRRGEGIGLGNLGNAYSVLGQVERAMEYYKQALVISREIGNRQLEGSELGHLGAAYHSLGQVERAMGYYEQALVITREIGDRRREGAWLGHLGAVYSDLGQVERAMGYYEQALVISREIGDRYTEGAWLSNLGNAYGVLGQVERAMEYYKQALVISRKIGDRRGESIVLDNLGNAYRTLRQVERAMGYYEQALVISREIGNRQLEGSELSHLGVAYSTLEQVERAIEYHEQALVITREIGDRRLERSELSHLGVAYSALGQVERAIEYHEQALATRETVLGEEHPDTALSLQNLGTLLQAQGDLAGARPYYERALAIRQKVLGKEHPDTLLTWASLVRLRLLGCFPTWIWRWLGKFRQNRG